MRWSRGQKYVFDLIIVASAAVVIIPALLICALAILVSDGRPILYRSTRRIFRQHSIVIPKFRTMRRDAERIANRITVPITNTRFLNIASDSPLYTPVGRQIERFMLTEMPQLYCVLRGQMSLVGNRPLPENVIAALKEGGHEVESRFLSPAGLTGPVQLVGRDFISDGERLRLEIAYCRAATQNYSAMLDLKILFYTVMVGLFPQLRFTPERVSELIEHHAARTGWFNVRIPLAHPKRSHP